MRVYIPFDDGSSVSYDGRRFVVHNPPVEIDADLSALSDGRAAESWRTRRGEVVRALEDAWWRKERLRREEETKKIYTKNPTAPPERK